MACLATVLWLGAAHALSVAEEQREAPDTPALPAVMQASDCASCHDLDRRAVGPSYREVASRYAGQSGASQMVARSIREGGSGRWGEAPMTPHPDLADEDLSEMVAWVLSLDAGTSDAGAGRSYVYALADGTSVELDFPLFIEGQEPQVTREVFRGYLMYNSYCYRCHGQDATESQLAPDLKRSLDSGMTVQEFLTIAMVGDEAAGMPSWAGFLTEEEVRQTYMYVEGRRLGLVPVGRPPSDY